MKVDRDREECWTGSKSDCYRQSTAVSFYDPGKTYPRQEVGGREDTVDVPFMPGRVTGPVKLVNKLMERWKLDLETVCAVLGYDKSEKTYVQGLLSGINTLQSRDMKDRIANLTEIYIGLYSLFRNPDSENSWLREPQEMLGGASARTTLAEGSMEKLITVRQLVEYLCGR